MRLGSSALITAALFNRGLTVGVQLVIGSLLAPAEVGVYAVAAAYCTLLSLFQSADLARVSLQAPASLERHAMAIQNWLALGCGLMWMLAALGQRWLPANVVPQFLLILMLLPLLRVMGNTRVAMLSVRGDADKVAIATVIEGVARGVALVSLVFAGMGATALLLAEVLAVAAATVYLMVACRMPAKVHWRIDPELRPKLGLSWAAGALMLVDREFSTFAIGTFCTVASAGSFFFANRIAGQAAAILSPLLTVETLPRLLRGAQTGMRSRYLEIRQTESKRLLRVGLITLGVLGIAGPLAMLLIWGDRWRTSAFMLPALAVVAGLRLAYGFQRIELEALGDMRGILRLSAVDAAALMACETGGALLWDAPGVIAAMMLETSVMLWVARVVVRQRTSLLMQPRRGA